MRPYIIKIENITNLQASAGTCLLGIGCLSPNSNGVNGRNTVQVSLSVGNGVLEDLILFWVIFDWSDFIWSHKGYVS